LIGDDIIRSVAHDSGINKPLLLSRSPARAKQQNRAVPGLLSYASIR